MATIGSFLGPWSWQLDLLTHFRPQLATIGLVAIVMALLTSARMALVVSLITTLINVAPLAPYLSGGVRAAEGSSAADHVRLRVLTFNMHGQGADPDAFRQMVERENPDVILLAEAPHDTSYLLHGWENRYPHRISDYQGFPLGVVLLSRWEPRSWSADRSAARFRSVLTTRLCHPNLSTRCFTLVGLHAAQPFGNDLKRQRTQLDIAAREVKAASTDAVILMGDLNLTPWSPAFQSLIGDAELYDTARVRKFTATWSSRFPLFGLPIDHILINRGFSVIESRVGRDLGSDHFPVLADLMLAAKP
ncbi:endonuclease/exonuclease/phosphatase family protein [Microvirga sp. VF16]|uniref:endonuclease/exonuclease/phosphatase family protein n=1 Tax=Microvirga sp. VF16 TaxID=2807101 RepID=UPI00193E8674|nr:endonuclease/exonuclease/phosphatase family protein [Microvirga sp. VF16]QRM27998.1 endonuclease/exonuclease/phosphatase family protein [Microvirga sp. VF16]